MAENSRGELNDRRSAVRIRVGYEENRSAYQIEIRRLTGERNRPDDSVKCIVDANARGLRAIVSANPAMPCPGLPGRRAR